MLACIHITIQVSCYDDVTFCLMTLELQIGSRGGKEKKENAVWPGQR